MTTFKNQPHITTLHLLNDYTFLANSGLIHPTGVRDDVRRLLVDHSRVGQLLCWAFNIFFT